jgi:hypothetical protein
MRTATLLCCLLLCACFGSVTAPIQCGPEGECGSGRQCVNGWCVAAPSSLPDASALTDAGTDQRPPEPGCRNGGEIRLGPSASACPGTFAAGAAAAQCATGWAVCNGSNAVDLNLCNSSASITGFFIADVVGAWTNNYLAPLCRMTTQETDREVFFGCGKTNGKYTFPADNPCMGFRASLECATVMSSWRCAVVGRPHVLADAINNNPVDGVLCCKS